VNSERAISYNELFTEERYPTMFDFPALDEAALEDLKEIGAARAR